MALHRHVAHGVAPVALAGAAADGARFERVVATGDEAAHGHVAQTGEQAAGLSENVARVSLPLNERLPTPQAARRPLPRGADGGPWDQARESSRELSCVRRGRSRGAQEASPASFKIAVRKEALIQNSASFSSLSRSGFRV